MKRVIAIVALAATPALAQPGAVPPVDGSSDATSPAEPPTPATEPAPQAAAEDAALADESSAAGDDIDLGALGLDPNAPVFDDKLQIFGFADFSWSTIRFSSPLIPETRAFSVGNLNVYLQKNLSPRWRSLAEVRLLFAPNGSTTNFDPKYTNTAVSDVANIERPIAWGGISIQRAHVEYDVAPSLTIRAGRFLTPYGIWNIDHGSPAIIGLNRPYIIGEHFFPEHQTGIEAFGSKTVGDYRVDYHATFSNGRNPFEATRDPDKRPAVGARVAATAPWAGTLKAGVSGYAGRATEQTETSNAGVSYDERAFGLDVSWDRGGFHAQGELLMQQRRYRANERAARGSGFAPDSVAYGFYGIAGYRFSSVWNAMPYVFFEQYNPADPTLIGEYVRAHALGVNLRPLPTVVLKIEATYVQFAGSAFISGDAKALGTQAAWVF